MDIFEYFIRFHWAHTLSYHISSPTEKNTKHEYPSKFAVVQKLLLLFVMFRKKEMFFFFFFCVNVIALLNSDRKKCLKRWQKKPTVFSNTFRQTSRRYPCYHDLNLKYDGIREFGHMRCDNWVLTHVLSSLLFVFVHFSLKWIVDDKGRHNNTLFSGWLSPVAHLFSGFSVFLFVFFSLFTSWGLRWCGCGNVVFTFQFVVFWNYFWVRFWILFFV